MPAPLHPFAVAAPSFALALPDALPIERLDILAFDGHFFARAHSGERVGTAALNGRTPALISLWRELVFPFWLGRDARDVTADVATIARSNRNDMLAGAPFWMSVAGVELALWDLLGLASNCSVAALFREKPRRKMPVYLSSPRRDAADDCTAAEVDWLAEAVARSGAKAVKIKIGGHSRWSEATDARDRELLELARQKWGEKFVIYADAEGSFEADKAIEVGQMLHENRVAWFEEPCNWQDFEAMRAVAANVQLPVAGGKADSSFFAWKWLLENCALDIVQPDLMCNGGFWRSWQVAHFAAQLDVTTAPHSPRSGPQALPALHLAAALEKPAPFLEWDARLPALPSWFASPLAVGKGAVNLPKGAGWGAVYDDEIWNRAEILASASV